MQACCLWLVDVRDKAVVRGRGGASHSLEKFSSVILASSQGLFTSHVTLREWVVLIETGLSLW